jgi:hypothetical protein
MNIRKKRDDKLTADGERKIHRKEAKELRRRSQMEMTSELSPQHEYNLSKIPNTRASSLH